MNGDSTRVSAEIVHVLFMDIVGYSLLSIEQQSSLRRELQEVVQDTPEYVRGAQRAEVIRRDLGDGLALVFARDPIAPVQCAVEVAKAIRNRPHLRLRMGVHSGPVVRDCIGENENVAGGGINIAQRVMDCGDAGHILLSRSTAESLVQFSAWTDFVFDLGEYEVKHGIRLQIFNLVTPEAGNPLRPARVPAAPAANEQSQGNTKVHKIVILYRRNAQPDTSVMEMLDRRLIDAGYEVFIDRRLSVGVQWAAEIERQICSADAIIPLLSAAAVGSEMLEYELQTAHGLAERQDGRPRILPVRIAYTDSLPPEMAAILDPLQYVMWNSAEDDDLLLGEILKALHPTDIHTSVAGAFESVGGAVPLDSQFYIERPTDFEFHEAIAREDSIVLIKGARQIGKTSLLARGLQRAREAGSQVVITDFQKLSAASFENADALFYSLANLIADQLDLDTSPRSVWSEDRSPSSNFERFFRREVLNKMLQHVVWGLDEVDRLFTCPFGSDVFALFRSWHNERSLDPGGPWRRSTLAITYATEAYLFITDINQSPFNVGTRLTLSDFTHAQVMELNARYGSPLKNANEVTRYLDLLSGHPYLTRRGLSSMATQAVSIDTIEAQAELDESIFGDHLRRILVLLAKDPELCDIMRAVLQGQHCSTDEGFYRLRSAGVLSGETRTDAHPRCKLYSAYLSRHLLQ